MIRCKEQIVHLAQPDYYYATLCWNDVVLEFPVERGLGPENIPTCIICIARACR